MANMGLGVIGLGRMGRVYAEHIARSIQGGDLVAVADPFEEVAHTFVSQLDGVTAYTRYEDLLEDATVEAVVVATPTRTHQEVVIAAAAAGKHIFCEKPTALTLAATDEMIEAVEGAGVLFQVGFMRRFDAAHAAAKQQIENGVIGQPVMVRSIGRDPSRTSLEYAKPENSGGLIVDMGIHDFDLVRWFMGDEIERVYTETASLVYPELLDVNDVDTALISLRLANGGLGNIEVSRTAIYGYDIQCNIVGTEGALQVGYLQQTPLLTLTKTGVMHDVVPAFPERFGPAYTAQIEHFVDCVLNEDMPAVTHTDARAALQASLAARQSQLIGEVVYIDKDRP